MNLKARYQEHQEHLLAPVRRPNAPSIIGYRTRSTIEVSHFRYFVSEKRGSLTPMSILISKKKNAL